jgi:hypothetical protein
MHEFLAKKLLKNQILHLRNQKMQILILDIEPGEVFNSVKGRFCVLVNISINYCII